MVESKFFIDEVIPVELTFPATSNIFIYNGRIKVFLSTRFEEPNRRGQKKVIDELLKEGVK